MLKTITEKFIRRYKNSEFSFDSRLPSSFLYSLIFHRILSILRGLKILFRLKIPKFLMLGRGVSFRNSSKIDIGRSVFIDDFVCLDGLGKGRLSIGHSVTIGAYSRLIISTNYQRLGEYIHIGNYVGIAPDLNWRSFGSTLSNKVNRILRVQNMIFRM